MNFIPCRLETEGEAVFAVLSADYRFPIPADRRTRYAPHCGRDLVFGLRPEHITERRPQSPAECVEFDALLDVVEPMGMETMVFFNIGAVEVSARVAPAAAGDAGQRMPLMADLRHMHVIDPENDNVP